jgi:hypothetical protein
MKDFRKMESIPTTDSPQWKKTKKTILSNLVKLNGILNSAKEMVGTLEMETEVKKLLENCSYIAESTMDLFANMSLERSQVMIGAAQEIIDNHSNPDYVDYFETYVRSAIDYIKETYDIVDNEICG